MKLNIARIEAMAATATDEEYPPISLEQAERVVRLIAGGAR